MCSYMGGCRQQKLPVVRIYRCHNVAQDQQHCNRVPPVRVTASVRYIHITQRPPIVAKYIWLPEHSRLGCLADKAAANLGLLYINSEALGNWAFGIITKSAQSVVCN